MKVFYDKDCDLSLIKGKNVAIIVHDGVELLDFAGPGEVFESARLQGAAGGEPWFHVYTVGLSSRPVVSQRFLTVRPEHTIENCPPPDILVVPGGATSVLLRDDAFMAWFRRTAPRFYSCHMAAALNR